MALSPLSWERPPRLGERGAPRPATYGEPGSGGSGLVEGVGTAEGAGDGAGVEIGVGVGVLDGVGTTDGAREPAGLGVGLGAGDGQGDACVKRQRRSRLGTIQK